MDWPAGDPLERDPCIGVKLVAPVILADAVAGWLGVRDVKGTKILLPSHYAAEPATW
jgi:hypothetical protein